MAETLEKQPVADKAAAAESLTEKTPAEQSTAQKAPAAESMAGKAPAYKRILLKLSGEALMGDDNYGINRDTIQRIVAEVAEVAALGVEIAVVIGGGNIFRGVAPGASHMDRATAD